MPVEVAATARVDEQVVDESAVAQRFQSYVLRTIECPRRKTPTENSSGIVGGTSRPSVRLEGLPAVRPARRRAPPGRRSAAGSRTTRSTGSAASRCRAPARTASTRVARGRLLVGDAVVEAEKGGVGLRDAQVVVVARVGDERLARVAVRRRGAGRSRRTRDRSSGGRRAAGHHQRAGRRRRRSARSRRRSGPPPYSESRSSAGERGLVETPRPRAAGRTPPSSGRSSGRGR